MDTVSVYNTSLCSSAFEVTTVWRYRNSTIIIIIIIIIMLYQLSELWYGLDISIKDYWLI